jgi:hypothetical protein
VKYAIIDRNRIRWPVCVLCETLEVSPSGYHQRQQRRKLEKLHAERISHSALFVQIKSLHAQMKGEYG